MFWTFKKMYFNALLPLSCFVHVALVKYSFKVNMVSFNCKFYCQLFHISVESCVQVVLHLDWHQYLNTIRIHCTPKNINFIQTWGLFQVG